MLNVIGSIYQKLTTSHVIGELQGLQSSRLGLAGAELTSFWDESIDLLKQWNLDEKLVRLLDLDVDGRFGTALSRIGPPDAGLIKLAFENNCILITEDERSLYREACAAGVDCRLLMQLIHARA